VILFVGLIHLNVQIACYSWIFIFIFWNECSDLRKWNECPDCPDFYFYLHSHTPCGFGCVGNGNDCRAWLCGKWLFSLPLGVHFDGLSLAFG
jgi:hypothetical protein